MESINKLKNKGGNNLQFLLVVKTVRAAGPGLGPPLVARLGTEPRRRRRTEVAAAAADVVIVVEVVASEPLRFRPSSVPRVHRRRRRHGVVSSRRRDFSAFKLAQDLVHVAAGRLPLQVADHRVLVDKNGILSFLILSF